jgi:hypothetical protein
MGKPLVRFREGQEIQPGYGRDIVAPPRKQVATEKTNFFLQSRKAPVYSKDQIEPFPHKFQRIVLGQPGNGCLLRGKGDEYPSPPG